MPANETTICNLALSKFGSKRIQSLEDASPEARACKLNYGPTRDEVLRTHRWNFAMKRATLSRLTGAPPFGWAAWYQLPVDCLRVFQLNGWEDHEQRDRWEVEGGRLLTDEDEAQIKYAARVTDGNLYDAIFVKALACKLAAEICRPLTGGNAMAGDLLSEYERLTSPKARRADAAEGRSKRKLPWVESDFVRARRG